MQHQIREVRKTLRMLAVVGVCCGGLSGCTFTPHQVKFTAAPVMHANTQIGAGTTLSLHMLDDRDRRTVGQRGIGAIGADVTAPALMPYLTQQITTGFRAQGFTLVSDQSHADAQVTVSLRSFRWDVQMGFFTGGEDVYVSIKAEGTRADRQEDVVKTYQYDSETRAFFVAHGAEISEKMDAGLAAVLSQLFSDTHLLEFLAGKTS